MPCMLSIRHCSHHLPFFCNKVCWSLHVSPTVNFSILRLGLLLICSRLNLLPDQWLLFAPSLGAILFMQYCCARISLVYHRPRPPMFYSAPIVSTNNICSVLLAGRRLKRSISGWASFSNILNLTTNIHLSLRLHSTNFTCKTFPGS